MPLSPDGLATPTWRPIPQPDAFAFDRAPTRAIDMRDGWLMAQWRLSPTHQNTMSRLTITLSEPRYRALKQASATRGKTITQLVDESLEFYGIKSVDDALALVTRARARGGLGAAQANKLAVAEVRAMRKKR